mgnify:CR=1 FL=1
MEIWIGIDGGGTKTELVAIGASEQIETNLTGRSSNPHAVGFEKAMAELTRLISEAVRTAPSAASAAAAPSAASGPSASASSSSAPAHLQGIALGLAGVSTPAERAAVTQALTSFLQEQGWSVPLLLRSEAEIALMAALGRPYGAAVIAGTGSNAIGVTSRGIRHQVGGWGHLLGDEGSGYQIGLKVLQGVMRSYHRLLPATIMTDRIVADYRFQSITDLKSYVYQQHIAKADIAAFARYAIEAAPLGDELALRILDEEAGKLAESAAALLDLDPEFVSSPVVLIGSVFTHSEYYTRKLQEQVRMRFPQAAFILADARQSPAFGAALLAKRETERNQKLKEQPE